MRELIARLERQRGWSQETFGPHQTAAGILAHMGKELGEIAKDPTDPTEWMDVVCLAFDGAMRFAATPADVVHAWIAKLDHNESRQWPDWRTQDPDGAIEHVRDPALMTSETDNKVEAAVEQQEFQKTATIRAVQYLGQQVDGVCTGGSYCKSRGVPYASFPHIHGLEGDLTVSHGDWIATGVQGEHWAIKPDVFAASYAPVSVSKEAADQRCERLAAEVERLRHAHTEACDGLVMEFNRRKAAEAKLSALVEAVKGGSIQEQSVGDPDPSRRQASVIVTWYGEGSLGRKNALSDTLRGIPPLEPISDHTAEPGGLTPGDAGRTAGAAAGDKSALASLDRTACEIPDFLKRQTGELPPAPMPAWRDDGREGRREGAEEDPEPAQEVAGLVPGDLEWLQRLKWPIQRGRRPPFASMERDNARIDRILTAPSSSPSQGGETKWVCVHCGHADGQPHDPSCPLAKPIPDVSGLVEALEKPPCAAGCEGLCEQKYVAEPDVHACCVVRRLHRAYAAFQSRKEEKQP